MGPGGGAGPELMERLLGVRLLTEQGVRAPKRLVSFFHPRLLGMGRFLSFVLFWGSNDDILKKAVRMNGEGMSGWRSA